MACTCVQRFYPLYEVWGSLFFGILQGSCLILILYFISMFNVTIFVMLEYIYICSLISVSFITFAPIGLLLSMEFKVA